MRLSQIGKGTRGGFSFRKILEELTKVDPKKAQSTAGKSVAQGLVGKANDAISKLKIKKGPASFASVIDQAKKQSEEPKRAATTSLVKGVLSKDKEKVKESGKSLAAAVKKKDKKPMSLGAATINV